MKKWFSITMLCVVFGCLSGFSQANLDLKRSVCVVRKSVSEEDKERMKKIAKVLYDNSYMAASRYLEKSKGGFGSGFVTKNNEGKLVLVTNKHVVKEAELVDLTFTINDKDTVLAGCPVIAKSDTMDIALVAFPEDKQSLVVPLQFETEKLQDGISVWTAGFPGLGDDPAWQLGNGIVSNGSYYNLEMSDSAHVKVIQHTAQVDPGSSGGPLLIKKGDQYYVVGMNTWKALARENANFSLTSSDVKAYLNSPEKKSVAASTSSKSSLNKRAEKFKSAVKEQVDSLATFFSDEMILSYNESQVNAVLASVSAYSASYLRNSNPINGLKLASADVVKALIKNPEKFVVSNVSSSGDKGTVTYKYKKDVITTKWRKEKDGWKITSTDMIPEKEVKSGNFGISYGGFIDDGFRILNIGDAKRIELLVWPSLDKDGVAMEDDNSDIFDKETFSPQTRFGFSYASFVGRFMFQGFELDLGNVKYTAVPSEVYEEALNVADYFTENRFAVGLSYFMGAHCPMAINRLFLSPEILVNFGIVASEDFSAKITASPSLNVGYILDAKRIIYGGVGYELYGRPTFSKKIPDKYNFLTLKVGYIF